MLTRDERLRQRARVAALRRHYPDRPDLYEDDQRTLKADSAERYIRELIDVFPPLSDEQRTRLALLLRGSPAGGREGAGDAA